MSVTFAEVQAAIKQVELHHFRDTTLVACVLLMQDGRVVMGTAHTPQGERFDISAVAAQARASADAQVAAELERHPLPIQSVAERSDHGRTE